MQSIVIREPGKQAHKLNVRDGQLTMELLQRIVGGNIEVINPDGFPDDVVLICNEEGKLRGLDFNRFVMINGQRDVICGTCIICAVGIVDGEQDLIPLTEEQAKEMLDALNG